MKRASFSAELRWAINRTGMSEAAFARSIGMSATYLSRILNQEDYRPSPEMIRRFADGLRAPVETVAAWSDIPDAMGLAAMPEPAPVGTPLARDSDRLSVREMVADIEARKGEWFQRQLQEAREELSREDYESFCIDLWRMFEGNSLMAFGNLRRGV